MTIEIWKNDTIASKYLISSVYRPTGLVDALTRFIEEFSCYLDDMHIYIYIYIYIYICGDMIINVLKIDEHNNYNTFYESATESVFMPQIILHTRLSDTSDRLIDNIFTNNVKKNHKNFLLTRIIFDHQITCCILPNHNAVKRLNRAYIEVENINEEKNAYLNKHSI